MFSNSVPSLADIAAVTNSGDGFGGNNGAWWIILLVLIFGVGGWGNRGGAFGGSCSTGSGITDGYILTSDFANIERKIDGVNNGLCDGFYAMNTGMLNGFSGVNNAITQQTIAEMQNVNALTSQLQNCCCENKSQIADVKYAMATDTCAINNNIQNVTRDITDNQNANTRAILEALNAQTLAAKNDKITELTAQVNALTFAASQQAQNSYLLSQLQPVARPSYIVPSPYTSNPCANCAMV